MKTKACHQLHEKHILKKFVWGVEPSKILIKNKLPRTMVIPVVTRRWRESHQPWKEFPVGCWHLFVTLPWMHPVSLNHCRGPVYQIIYIVCHSSQKSRKVGGMNPSLLGRWIGKIGWLTWTQQWLTWPGCPAGLSDAKACAYCSFCLSVSKWACLFV